MGLGCLTVLLDVLKEQANILYEPLSELLVSALISPITIVPCITFWSLDYGSCRLIQGFSSLIPYLEPVGHGIQEFCETARCKIAETLAERQPTGTPVKVKGLGFRAPACYVLDGVDVFKNTSRNKH